MASAETRANMVELYQNECFGDVLVDAVMAGIDDPAARQVLGTIAQFETETKARLRPWMMALGLPTVTTRQTFEAAETMAAGMRGLAWPVLLRQSHAHIRDDVVPRFRAIAAIAAEDGDRWAMAIADYMVIHEVAILDLLERALAGDPHPTRGVDALLHFPLGDNGSRTD